MKKDKNTFWKRFRILGSIAVLLFLIGLYFLSGITEEPYPPDSSTPVQIDK